MIASDTRKDPLNIEVKKRKIHMPKKERKEEQL